MRLRNCFHIALDNIGSVYKLLLYRLIVGVIISSLVYVILKLGLETVTKSVELAQIKSLVVGFVQALFSGDTGPLQTFHADIQVALSAFVQMLVGNIGPIIGSVIGLFFVYLVGRFVNGLGIFATATTLDDRMGTFSRTKFSAAFFKYIGKGALYQIIYVPLSFVYDLLSVFLCWFLFFYTPSLLPSWGVVNFFIAISLTLTALVAFQALKMTLISAWMPAMIEGKESVGKGLKTALTFRRGFARRFSDFVISSYLIVVVNAAVALFTFGSALLLTVPMSFIFLLIVQFVHYYEENGRKYFISNHKIVGGEDKLETE